MAGAGHSSYLSGDAHLKRRSEQDAFMLPLLCALPRREGIRGGDELHRSSQAIATVLRSLFIRSPNQMYDSSIGVHWEQMYLDLSMKPGGASKWSNVPWSWVTNNVETLKHEKAVDIIGRIL
jgi:hypothetical protein